MTSSLVTTPAATPIQSAQSPPGLLHAAGNYFATADGHAVYLAGNHTWTDGQDIGATPFDFAAYLDVLHNEGANLIRLWAWQSAIDGGGAYGPVGLLPYAQVTGGKFDLTQFNQAYFDALRAKVDAAGAKGLYVSVMLFNGNSVDARGSSNNPWLTNPFNAANNVNGINGDPNNTGTGDDTQTLGDPAILAAQEAYVAKVIQTVGDLPNVLFEVANETAATPQALAWQNAIVDFIHSYEASHGALAQPVGITAPWSPNATLSPAALNSDLHASDADWISPSPAGYLDTSTPATGDKPVIVDTDHVYGIGGNVGWVWEQFTNGNNVLAMDDLSSTGVAGTLPGVSLSAGQVASETGERLGIAETRQVSTMVDLTGMTPTDPLASTGYALADLAAGKYVIYAPDGGSFTVDLSGASGKVLDVRWMDVASGQVSVPTTIAGGAGQQLFTSPSGAAALILTPSAAASPAPPTQSGQDTLVIDLSEAAWQGDAQAIISLDGRALTAQPVTVTALHGQGQSQAFTLTGDFGAGPHQVGVSFINDAWGGTSTTDRNLFVNGVTLDGTASPDLSQGVAEMDGNGTRQFATVAPATSPPTPPLPPAPPSGQDTLVVSLSETAWQGDAQAIVSLDGRALTGQPVTVTALHGQGQTQAFSFTGNFGAGPHQVGVSFINDAWGGTSTTDRNLFVNGVTLDGTASPDLSQGVAEMDGNGTRQFATVAPATSPPTPPPPQDTLTLHVSEDAWQGDAAFTIQVDGRTIGQPQMAFASHAAGQSQAFIVQGAFGPGPHQVGVTFLNDAWGGTPSTDRNLYLDGVSFDGETFLNQSVPLLFTNAQASANVDTAAPGLGAQLPSTFTQPDVVLALH